VPSGYWLCLTSILEALFSMTHLNNYIFYKTDTLNCHVLVSAVLLLWQGLDMAHTLMATNFFPITPTLFFLFYFHISIKSNFILLILIEYLFYFFLQKNHLFFLIILLQIYHLNLQFFFSMQKIVKIIDKAWAINR
jgi:hypothetical protein